MEQRNTRQLRQAEVTAWAVIPESEEETQLHLPLLPLPPFPCLPSPMPSNLPVRWEQRVGASASNCPARAVLHSVWLGGMSSGAWGAAYLDVNHGSILFYFSQNIFLVTFFIFLFMLFISVVPYTQFLNHFSRSRPCSSLCPVSAPHRKCIIVTAQMVSPQQLCRGSAGKLRECSHICIWFSRETRGHRVEVSQGNISNRGKKGKNWKNILRGFHWLAGKKDRSTKLTHKQNLKSIIVYQPTAEQSLFKIPPKSKAYLQVPEAQNP